MARFLLTFLTVAAALLAASASTTASRIPAASTNAVDAVSRRLQVDSVTGVVRSGKYKKKQPKYKYVRYQKKRKVYHPYKRYGKYYKGKKVYRYRKAYYYKGKKYYAYKKAYRYRHGRKKMQKKKKSSKWH